MGCDIERGQCILSAGQLVGASEIGLLASVGVTSGKCHCLPRVGIMSTGNEVSV
jgi:gephyrin